MRRKSFCLTSILISISFYCASQTFMKTYGGTGSDIGNAVQQTFDDGYIILGTKNTGTFSAKVYLIKVNIFGDTLWTKTYGGTSYDYGYSVARTLDSGFIISGMSYSFGLGADDVYILKVDSLGNLQWTKTIGGMAPDWGNYVQQTTDSGYIVAGRTFSINNPNGEAYLIKIDILGNILWSKSYDATIVGNTRGYSAFQTNDGGFIITGEGGYSNTGSYDVFLLKTDESGNPIWEKTYGGINGDLGNSVKQTNDGGFIIVGFTGSFGVGNKNIYLIKTDVSGDTLWTKAISVTGFDEGNSVAQTNDGGYIIASTQNILVKTDSAGNIMWAKMLGAAVGSFGSNYSVEQTPDNGFIVVGNTGNFGAGSFDVFLTKTDSSGNSTCNIKTFAAIASSTTTQVINQNVMVHSGGTVNNTNTIVSSDCKVCNPCVPYVYFSGLPDTTCIFDSPSILSGFPFGGLFSGDGVIDSIFNPDSAGLGTHFIFYSYIDSFGCGILYGDSVFVDICASVLHLNHASGLTIFPNPSSGNFIITLETTVMKANVEIYNVVGEKVFEEHIFNESKNEINLKDISGGIYFLKVFDGEKSYCKKLIVE
jgi:hypothetical protein